ncbi:MAG TPA: hypothetical protein PKE20_09695 [Promineifilum sp.]|nr:hypothetical protein [Promineifilum sp.]
MPAFEFTGQKIPLFNEVLNLLQEAEARYDPLEELLRLERELASLEMTYSRSSADFFERYQAGELGDDFAYITWAGRYRLYLNLKRTISESLRIVMAVTDAPSD